MMESQTLFFRVFYAASMPSQPSHQGPIRGGTPEAPEAVHQKLRRR